MPPTPFRLAENSPGPVLCKASSSRASNLTLMDGLEAARDSGIAEDHEGAMKFIIAVLLVYSLLGTAGTMVLRFRQSAAKQNKYGAMKEANRYLKHRDKISSDYQLARLVKETNRVLDRIHTMESRGEREGFRGLCTSPAVISSSCVVSAPQDLVGDSKSEKCSSVSEESQDRLLKQSPATGDPEQSRVQRESQSVLQQTPSANGAYLSRGAMDTGTSPRSSESPRLLLQSAVRTLPGHADSAQLYHDWFLTASRSQFLPMPLSLQVVPPNPHPSTHVTLPVEPAFDIASLTPGTTTGSALHVTLTEPFSATAPPRSKYREERPRWTEQSQRKACCRDV